jgi:hypothetical protein
LYNKIIKLGQYKNLRKEMGRESRDIIKEKIEIKSIVGRLEGNFVSVAPE